ncbi:MAG: hypothetical protein ACRCX2_23585 [Paraclostridium sp.]
MNIDEMIANRNMLVEENRYDKGGTLGRLVFGAGVVGPGMDNLVINATGKKNGLPFLTALHNGGHYRNNTFLGGNFLAGEGLFDGIPGFKMKNDISTHFLSDKSFFGYKAQYYNAKSTEIAGITDDLITPLGRNKDFIIQSGIGFSKDYKGFFNTLNKQGFDYGVNKQLVNNLVSNSGEGILKNVDNDILRDIYNVINPKATDVSFNNWANHLKEGNIPTKELHKVIENNPKIKNAIVKNIETRKESTIKNAVDGTKNATGKKIQGELTEHINNLSDREVFELAENTGFGRSTKKALGNVSNKAKMALNISDGTSSTDDILKFLNSNDKLKLFDEIVGGSKVNLNIKSKVKYVDDWLRNGNMDKPTKAIIDKFTKDKAKRILSPTVKNLKKNMIRDVGDEFFNVTGLQKLFSNKYMQVATGNFVSGAVAIPLAVATGFISVGAMQHQEQSVNNFKDMFFFDNNPILDYHSEEAMRTSYQHQQLSQSNDQDIQTIKANRNIASRYANDITPIEIDSKATSVSNFSII